MLKVTVSDFTHKHFLIKQLSIKCLKKLVKAVIDKRMFHIKIIYREERFLHIDRLLPIHDNYIGDNYRKSYV